MKKFFGVVVSLVTAAVLVACGSGSNTSSTGELESVNIGYFPNLDHAAGIIGKEKGFFQDHLGDVQAEFRNYPNGNDFIDALDTGIIDIGYVGPGPAINYFLRGGDVVVLSAAANGATLIVSREDSGIKTLEDFDGKSFCTPGNGCTHNVQLEIMLQELGLKSNRLGGTVEHFPRVAPSDTIIRFEMGDIDAVAAPEPYGTYLVERLNANVVVEWDNVFLGQELASVVLVTTNAFLEAHPEVVDNVLRGHIQSVNYTQENVDDTLDTFGEFLYSLSQSNEFSKDILEKAWNRMVITTDTHADALQAWADASYQLDFIQDEPNLDGFVNTTRLDALLAE